MRDANKWLDSLANITNNSNWKEDGTLTEETFRANGGEFTHQYDLIDELEKLGKTWAETMFVIRNPKDLEESINISTFRFQYANYLYTFDILHGDNVEALVKAERMNIVKEIIWNELI